MFTGLIEEVGKVKSIIKEKNGLRITISSDVILDDIKVDDSVAVNGTCLTVVAFDTIGFTVQAVQESVSLTTLKFLKIGDLVNTERALRLDSRLGGHIVQGHIDGVGEISKVLNNGLSIDYFIKVDSSLEKYIVKKGSITLDGISLTVTDIKDNILSVSIIPHTVKNTIIDSWKMGSKINVETDILGRYIEKLLTGNKNNESKLTLGRLAELGY